MRWSDCPPEDVARSSASAMPVRLRLTRGSHGTRRYLNGPLAFVRSAESSSGVVAYPQEFSVTEKLGFASAALETVRHEAGMTLESCDSGAWRNTALGVDADGNLTLQYPNYFVSGSIAPGARRLTD